jgi:hypothetical protein
MAPPTVLGISTFFAIVTMESPVAEANGPVAPAAQRADVEIIDDPGEKAELSDNQPGERQQSALSEDAPHAGADPETSADGTGTAAHNSEVGSTNRYQSLCPKS